MPWERLDLLAGLSGYSRLEEAEGYECRRLTEPIVDMGERMTIVSSLWNVLMPRVFRKRLRALRSEERGGNRLGNLSSLGRGPERRKGHGYEGDFLLLFFDQEGACTWQGVLGQLG